jgi:hypothetical protein
MTPEDLAERIASTFSMRPTRHGREYRVCCPVHEADGGVHRPSLAVWEASPGRAAMKCMTGCSLPAVKAALRARGVPVGQASLTTAQQLQAAKAKEARRVQQLTLVRDAWEEAAPVSERDPVDRYLRSRGIAYGAHNTTLRWVHDGGSIRCGLDPKHPSEPAMFCMIVDPASPNLSKATGMSILSLNRDGTPAVTPDGKKFRSIVGNYAGMAVPLGTPSSTVVVGEGVETVLAAMTLLEQPFGLATLSASNMPSIRLPEFVSSVLIAQDFDDAGAAAAEQLREELFVVGTLAVVHLWAGKPGWDASDELLRRMGT